MKVGNETPLPQAVRINAPSRRNQIFFLMLPLHHGCEFFDKKSACRACFFDVLEDAVETAAAAGEMGDFAPASRSLSRSSTRCGEMEKPASSR